MLGIVIGIASVIVLMSIGASAQNLILSQVQGIGSNLIFVIPGATKGSRFSSPASVQGIIIKTLVQNDIDALAREPSIVRVGPLVSGQTKAVYGNNDTTIGYSGTTASYFVIRNFTMSKGYAFTDEDVASFNRVAVLGSEIAKTLFGTVNPVGKDIRLRDTSFQVVGVLDSEGVGPLGVDQDNLIIIPMTVAQKQLLGIDYFNSITIEASDAYKVDFVQARVTSILRENHHITYPNKN